MVLGKARAFAWSTSHVLTSTPSPAVRAVRPCYQAVGLCTDPIKSTTALRTPWSHKVAGTLWYRYDGYRRAGAMLTLS